VCNNNKLQQIQLKHLILGIEIQKSMQNNIDGDPRLYTLSILPIGDAEYVLARLNNLLQIFPVSTLLSRMAASLACVFL
jgi:hypothetical protein